MTIEALKLKMLADYRYHRYECSSAAFGPYVTSRDAFVATVFFSEEDPIISIEHLSAVPGAAFVSMVDTFMSGWGPAEGKSNVMVVFCLDHDDGRQVARAANRRNEMTGIRIIMTPSFPSLRSPNVLVTLKHFDELGGTWKDES